MRQRLQKLLSGVGLCSRRTAEAWIEAGRVTVNGEKVRLGDQADPEIDDIRVDGKPLPGKREPVYLMLNKPRDRAGGKLRPPGIPGGAAGRGVSRPAAPHR